MQRTVKIDFNEIMVSSNFLNVEDLGFWSLRSHLSCFHRFLGCRGRVQRSGRLQPSTQFAAVNHKCLTAQSVNITQEDFCDQPFVASYES